MFCPFAQNHQSHLKFMELMLEVVKNYNSDSDFDTEFVFLRKFTKIMEKIRFYLKKTKCASCKKYLVMFQFCWLLNVFTYFLTFSKWSGIWRIASRHLSLLNGPRVPPSSEFNKNLNFKRNLLLDRKSCLPVGKVEGSMNFV